MDALSSRPVQYYLQVPAKTQVRIPVEARGLPPISVEEKPATLTGNPQMLVTDVYFMLTESPVGHLGRAGGPLLHLVIQGSAAIVDMRI